jgi:hypothetical protein
MQELPPTFAIDDRRRLSGKLSIVIRKSSMPMECYSTVNEKVSIDELTALVGFNRQSSFINRQSNVSYDAPLLLFYFIRLSMMAF